jgi:hypothetical protein
LDITRSTRAGDSDMEVLSLAATISGFAVTDSTTASVAGAQPMVADLAAGVRQ